MTKEKAISLLEKSDSLDKMMLIVLECQSTLETCSLYVDNCEGVVDKYKKTIANQKSIMLEKDHQLEAEMLKSTEYYNTIIQQRLDKKKLKRQKTWVIVGGVAAAILTGVGGYYLGKSIP